LESLTANGTSVFTGNVGIKTGSPYTTLDVNGNFSAGVRNTTTIPITGAEHYFGSSPSDLARNNIVASLNDNSVTSPRFRFYKSRGTSASPTATNSGDVTGDIQTYAYDGGAYRHATGISSVLSANSTSGSVSGYLSFGTNGGSTAVTERLRITSAGVVELTSGQLKFPATQSASADANTLDDYEEGTWTPVVADAATAGNTGTYTLDAGSAVYTKIGNLVTIAAMLRSINTSGMTSGNTFFIRGLPFVVNKRTFGTVQVDNVVFTNTICVDSVEGTASIVFDEANSGATGATIKVSDVTSGSGAFLFTFAYFAA
jgi:hypothetical protein